MVRFKVNQWSSICTTFNRSTMNSATYVNGNENPMNVASNSDFITKLSPYHMESLVLGASYEKEYNFNGKITDFNVWSRALSRQEAVDWTNSTESGTTEGGDYFSWERAAAAFDELAANSMNIIEVPDGVDSLKNYFDETVIVRTLSKMTFYSAATFCKQMGGNIFGGENIHDKETMRAQKGISDDNSVWAGYSDQLDPRFPTIKSSTTIAASEWMKGYDQFSQKKVYLLLIILHNKIQVLQI